MTDMADAAAAVTKLVATFGLTRDQMAEVLTGTIDGGPNGDGYYPVTLADGVTTVLVPSPRKLAELPVGVPLPAATIGDLQNFALQQAGRQVIVSDTKRGGLFVWTTGDQRAMVTADPYRGLIVPPAFDQSGASGAWARVVVDGLYWAHWWGIGATQGADNHLRFSSLLNPVLTPAGSVVRFLWRVPVVGPIFRKRDDITIEGAGPTSWIEPTVDVGGALFLTGSNITLRNFRCDSHGPMQHANANPAILLGLDTQAVIYSNWVIEAVTCRGSGHGIVVTASSVATLEADVSDDPTKLARPTNIDIRNCDIVVGQQAVSVFACKDVIVRDNRLRSISGQANVDGYKLAGRTVGSEDVLWINNKGSTDGDYAFRLDQLGRGVRNAANTATFTIYQTNKNVAWINNRMTGCELGAFYLGPTFGTCEIINNQISGEIGSTAARNAVHHPNSADPLRPLTVSAMENLVVRGNRFEGYSALFISNATEKRVLIRDNYVLGNACTAAYPAIVPVFWEFSAFTMAEVVGNQFLLGNGQQVGVRVTGPSTGKLRVTGNTFPEGISFYVHQPQGMGPAEVQLSSGGFDGRANGGFPTDPTGVGFHANDNGIYAAGSFAAAVA